MDKSKYLPETWYHPRLTLRPSPIHGQGLFVTDVIRAGETVMIFGGLVLTQAELDAEKLPPGQWCYDMIDEGLFMFAPHAGPDYFLNHACDANRWLADEVTLVARREIQRDEEVGCDYAMAKTKESYRLGPCRCGALLCRGMITGSDWLRPELQLRYQDHFMPYINRLIADLKSHA
jgi:uncharacterized protein